MGRVALARPTYASELADPPAAGLTLTKHGKISHAAASQLALIQKKIKKRKLWPP